MKTVYANRSGNHSAKHLSSAMLVAWGDSTEEEEENETEEEEVVVALMARSDSESDDECLDGLDH